MKCVNLIWVSFIFIMSCSGTTGEKEKEELVRLVRAWQGKEIFFPDSMVFMRYLTDTVNCQIPDTAYKVLVYIDPFGCTSCKLKLALC